MLVGEKAELDLRLDRERIVYEPVMDMGSRSACALHL
jgi:hypothetical protein